MPMPEKMLSVETSTARLNWLKKLDIFINRLQNLNIVSQLVLVCSFDVIKPYLKKREQKTERRNTIHVNNKLCLTIIGKSTHMLPL